MKKKLLFILAIGFAIFSMVVFADMPVATTRHTQVITTHFGDPNKPVKMAHHHWHHHAKVGETKVVALKHSHSYAVHPDNEAIKWLNEHTFGDILEHGAPVYNHQEEHLELSMLHPGEFHLDFTDMKEVESEKGYQALKTLMGDRIKLIPPKGPGYYVTIEILPSKHATKGDRLPEGATAEDPTPANPTLVGMAPVSQGLEPAKEPTINPHS